MKSLKKVFGKESKSVFDRYGYLLITLNCII